MSRIYERFSDEEINKLLEDIPQEKWFRHEELIKEGIQRYIKLMFNKSEGLKR